MSSVRQRFTTIALIGVFTTASTHGQTSPAPPLPPHVTDEVRSAIDRGLEFLVRSQNRDGSWRSGGPGGAYPTAMTALAGLALLAAGSTPVEGPYARHVSSALTYVLGNARRDGLIAASEELSNCMHGHGFAMLFLAECYGMEESPRRQAQIRDVLRRAIELTARSQSQAGGWLYTPDSGGDEGSVTVTQVQGLRAARNAGVATPKSVIDEAMGYLVKSTNPDGGITYRAGDGGPSRPPISAAAVVCWYNAGVYDGPRIRRALEYITRTLQPELAARTGHEYYAHLYMAQAMFLTGPEAWERYYPAVARRLLGAQAPDGSWDGDFVGTTYGTAVALIVLQLPYRHLPIMQR